MVVKYVEVLVTVVVDVVGEVPTASSVTAGSGVGVATGSVTYRVCRGQVSRVV